MIESMATYARHPGMRGRGLNHLLPGRALRDRCRLARPPRVRVARIVELARERRQPQGAERVPHHGELLGAAGAERLLDQARLRPVRKPGWMHRDRAHLDLLAAPELAGDVV